MYDAFEARVTALVNKFKVGDGMQGCTLGPLISPAAVDHVSRTCPPRCSILFEVCPAVVVSALPTLMTITVTSWQSTAALAEGTCRLVNCSFAESDRIHLCVW